ncbi:hypothetical protein WISP_41123 [Willisornis vidua]|uniref:Uncharacterized protein n=1 Tax=Willisornis vidua TaxID=1566151 RepID=A0ABQ9DMX5_9PASS|nr:hypothetical protein WISP_41123 [Willisornis vidua]
MAPSDYKLGVEGVHEQGTRLEDIRRPAEQNMNTGQSDPETKTLKELQEPEEEELMKTEGLNDPRTNSWGLEQGKLQKMLRIFFPHNPEDIMQKLSVGDGTYMDMEEWRKERDKETDFHVWKVQEDQA